MRAGADVVPAIRELDPDVVILDHVRAFADGKLYITNEEAVTSVIRAGPEFELLAENALEGFTLAGIADIARGDLQAIAASHMMTVIMIAELKHQAQVAPITNGSRKVR